MGGRPRFSHEARVDPLRLQYEPFKERGQVSGFDSGVPPLDEFLNTKEVEEYEAENLGRTTLVFLDGELVAYYTIGADALRLEYVDAKKLAGQHFKKGRERVESIPSLKIGRLAVQSGCQDGGIGRAIIRRISAIALESESAIRLLTTNAMERSIPFYLKCGFEMTLPVRREKGRRERTMYLDLLGAEEEIRAPLG